MKHLESKLQEACVKYFRYQYFELRGLLFAIGNGGARTKLQGAILKREGVLAGVADCFLSVPNKHWHGLYLEFKIEKGRQTGSQKEFQKNVEAQGYMYVIITNFDDFEVTIKNYLLRLT